MGTQSGSSTEIDAVLLLSFGGPEQPEDVLPFLRNVTRGRNVPDERLSTVAEQYQMFGGRSPINDQCRALIDALSAEFVANAIDLPIYWGNRNWHPFLQETVSRMAQDGVRRAAVFVTSAFGTYSGCRQYREDLAKAADNAGPAAPELNKLRLFYNHPGFIEPMANSLVSTLGPKLGQSATHRVVFTAHSIPSSMAHTCSYEAQLHEAASLIMAAANVDGLDNGYDLAFQSRSGPPSMPWLEPDINDHLSILAERGFTRVTIVPVGFISDHMEVMFDLDTQAAATAQKLGLTMTRAPTVGTHPRFVTMIRQLIEEQRCSSPPLFLGSDGPWPDSCPVDHCQPPARPPATRR